jgi:hypothetical protein
VLGLAARPLPQQCIHPSEHHKQPNQRRSLGLAPGVPLAHVIAQEAL